jgi:hypothetical protein
MRFAARTCLTLAVLGLVASASAAACIPDPKGDFEDYRDKTAGLGEKDSGPADVQALDTKPPDTATEALYVGVCVTALAAKDPAQALRFYTETKYTPGTGGADGKVTMIVSPLQGWDKAKNDYITPTAVSKANIRGPAITVPDVPVKAADGRFTANLGTINLPGEANSISGRDAVIVTAVLDGKFGVGEFCSTLGGNLTVPYAYTFNPKENTCLFIKVNEGDPVPTRASAQFVCPL